MQEVVAIAAVKKVVSDLTVELVIAGQTFEAIIAVKSKEDVDAGIAAQGVIVIRCPNIFDSHQHIARGVAGAVGRRGQIQGKTCCGVDIVRLVDARAAVEPIGPGPTSQDVVAVAAVKEIIAGLADQ